MHDATRSCSKNSVLWVAAGNVWGRLSEVKLATFVVKHASIFQGLWTLKIFPYGQRMIPV
jgi:hypothetical protein